ncbi:MAG: CDP-glycerol glycerophosphotransferase family protein, partial [Alphaproteobacteria bacterium]|nr:CDP-glycerol glycerophosphotransferase family protein [Alphaproteobacteria bacterium]
KIVADKADLLIFDYIEIHQNNKTYTSPNLSNVGVEKFRFSDSPSDFFYIMTGAAGKVYKNVKLPQFDVNLKKSEDTAFFWEYCLKKNPKISILNKNFYFYVVHKGSATHQSDVIKEGNVFKSVTKISSLQAFQEADARIQAYITDRYAKSLCWEIKIAKKLGKKYYSDCNKFIKTAGKYCKLYPLQYCEELKRKLFGAKHSFIRSLFKPIRIYQEQRHNVIKFFGLTLKIKRRCGRLGAEQHYINLVRRNYKKYPKDTYLLFDCLSDASAEAIDAYCLFEQMRAQNISAYYVILKKTALYQKLEAENKLDNVIVLNFSSRTHPNELMQKIHEVLYRTKCVITSFGGNSGTADMFFRRHKSWQYVYIKHGTIFMKESILYKGYLYPKKFDRFLVCSDREEKLFLKYGFPAEKLIKVGLPRWDLLNNLPKLKEKSILLMLTWRHLKGSDFEESLYKKNILNLLHNEKMMKYLQEKHITLYFAPHHALLGNMKVDFDLSDEKNIKVIDTNNISQYIRQCSCLVTDFSSVAFDFMFQNKPVLFYMLDKDDPLLERYDGEDLAKFEYKQYILPDVYFDEDSVVNRVIEYCENNFKIDDDTRKIYDSFFYTKKDIRKQLIDKLEQLSK